jgi:cytoskeletal protein RodZ
VNEKKLGDILRERREALNLSIKEVADATKLKKSVILALEEGDYKELPEPVYIHGFLKLYASVLGLDYRDLSPLLDKELRSAGKIEENNIEKGHNLSWTILIVIIVVGIVVSLFYFLSSRRQTQSPKTLEQPPPISKSTGEPTERTPILLPKSTDKGGSTEVVKKEIILELNGLDYSWIRVIVDEKKVFEGFINKGDHFIWKGKEKIKVRVGNAGGISIILNGKDLGVLGKRGEVLEKEFLPG